MGDFDGILTAQKNTNFEQLQMHQIKDMQYHDMIKNYNHINTPAGNKYIANYIEFENLRKEMQIQHIIQELFHGYLCPEDADPKMPPKYPGPYFFNVKNIAGFECERCKFLSNKYSKKKDNVVTRIT